MGLEGMINLEEEAIKYLIEMYTIEPGVRKLKEIIFDIIGEINLSIFKNTFEIESFPIILDVIEIKKYMKDKHELIPKEVEKENKIGIVNGMWANSLGQGGILPLYAQFYPSNNFLELKLTGSLEKIMNESIHVAETLAFSLLSQERKDYIYNEKKSYGIHIHAAEGAVSKDGPSGGVALTTLIYSLMNDYKIKQKNFLKNFKSYALVKLFKQSNLKITPTVVFLSTNILNNQYNKRIFLELFLKFKHFHTAIFPRRFNFFIDFL
jgi:ATP-dependent Lon protease